MTASEAAAAASGEATDQEARARQEQQKKQQQQQQQQPKSNGQDEKFLVLTKSKTTTTKCHKPIKPKAGETSNRQGSKMPPASQGEKQEASPRSGSRQQQQQLKQLAASLRAAANQGKVELVRLLLRCGANVNAQDEEFGNTALHQAAWNGFSESIQVLCKHRASTSIKNKAHFTPLHLACQQGHNQSARLLLMAGARPDAKNSYGDTALHTAARYGHAGVARICLSAKCNPNQVNKNDDTPLHIAAAMGRRKLTKILMQSGAEPAIKNKQNETAMDIALRKDLIEIQELIANPPASSSSRKQRRQATTSASAKYKSSSQLELLLGSLGQQSGGEQLLCSQLYSSSRLLATDSKGPNLSSNGHERRVSRGCRHKSSKRHHHFDESSHDFQHQLLMSGEEGGDDDEEELEIRPATRSAGRSSVEPRRSARQLARDSNVAPVDAGPAGRDPRRAGCQFTSESALNERAVDVGPGFQQRALPLRRLRTRTLVNGLEGRHEELVREERHQLKGGTFVIRPSSVGSVRRSLAEQLLQDLSSEPEGELCPLEATGAGFHKTRRSPTGSARSSAMSTSRRTHNRLVLKQRRLLAERASPAATSGTGGNKLARCMGNLSLLQLRNMVKKHAAQRKKQKLQLEETERKERVALQTESSQREGGEQALDDGQRDQEQSPQSAGGGRRQERLKRELATRAPNGAKLTNSRPLAPLNDESQLYAIPRRNLKTAASSGALASNGSASPPPAKQQVASDESAPKRNQVDAGPTRRLANDGSGAAQRETSGHLWQDSTAAAAPGAEGQSRQELRTIKTLASSTSTTTTTLELVKRANNLATATAGSPVEQPMQQTRQLDAKAATAAEGGGPALTGSDSGHSLSTASSRLKPTDEDEGHHKELQQHHHHQARRKNAASNSSSAAGSSCDLSSSCGSLGQQQGHRAASLSPADAQNNEARRADCELREPAANLVAVRTGDQLNYDDRDFCAPGYSVVLDTKRRQLGVPKQQQQQDDTCRCPLGLEEHQIDEQPAGKSPSGRLRQFLHLQAKPKAGLLSQVANGQRPKYARGDEEEEEEGEGEEEEEEEGEEDVEDDDRKLIRPKSALGGVNAELIAAQKSLAAAAAAKVQRDRQAKLARSKQETQSLNDSASANCRLLTVKTTSETPFWLQAHHGSHHYPLVAGQQHPSHHAPASISLKPPTSALAAANGPLIGSMMNIITGGPGGSHRSGTNSVGMSDSSPSNNGAESDNSIQTTTSGSLNTSASDGTATSATTAVAKSATSKSASSSTGPFGILSRILLNNSSRKQQQQQAKTSSKVGANKAPALSAKQQNGLSMNAALVAPASNGFNGSISSSSAMSSPSISNGQPTSHSSPDDASSTATAADQQKHKPKLGQLSSRSRQPIVLSNSNELVANGNATECEPQPRLPPKGVLKNGVSRDYGEHQFPARPGHSDALANGLPRVASYTQLSQQQQANLCNYHALNRSHMIQTKYSPYLPYNLGRYSIHETCDPSTGDPCGQHHQFAYYSRMATDPMAYSSAAPPPATYYNTTADLLNSSDTSMLCNYSHDDSAIYIPAYMSNGAAGGQHHYGETQHHHHHLAAGGPQQQPLMSARSAHDFNNVAAYVPHHMQNNANSTHLVDFNQQQRQQRPRSSLDSILLNTAASHQLHENDRQQQQQEPLGQSYGQPQKCNVQEQQQQAPTRPILVKRHSHELKLAPQSSSHSATTTMRDNYNHHADQQCHLSETSHFNVTQNSIYAGQSMLPLKSELTVLPAESNDATVEQQLGHHGDPSRHEQATQASEALVAANINLDKTTKHKSLVKVNLQMFEQSSAEPNGDTPPVLPPKTVGNGGKLTTRVVINQDWRQAESNGETVKRSETSEEDFDKFSGATVL